MRYLIVLLTLLPIRVLALELSVEDRACITAAAAKLPPVDALKIEDSRVVSQPPPQGQRNSNPYHVKVEIDVSVAGQTSTYVYNCIRDGQLTVIQPLGMTRRTPESGGVALPGPRPGVVSRQVNRQSPQQAYSGNSGGNYPNLNIRNFGAMGDGNSHPLSSIYSSLAAAQAVYPFVSDLTQEVDWAATQLAIDTGFANGVNSAYCPAVTAQNASYRLSNPIVIDKPHNTRGSYPAWNSRTTYGYDPNGSNRVTYNGLPWSSLGSGNVGNPPTSASGYPANLSIAGSNLPFATVTIANASPAVIGLNSHGFVAGQPLIFLAQTWGIGALPTGINANQVYYVISAGLTTNSFEVSATPGGSTINTSSSGTGVFTITTQVWGFDPNAGPSFSDRTNFIGDDGQASSEGCRYNSLSYTTIAFLVGPNNGNLIKDLNVIGPGATDFGQPLYRCQMPTTLVGIGNVSNGGGTSNTQYINLGVDGFYTGSRTNYEGGGTLGDQNTWWKPRLSDACEGVNINSQENFINTIYDGEIGGVTNMAVSILGAGLNIFGGNYSTSSSQTNTFTITRVTAANVSNQINVQATVSNPDRFLKSPMCGYNLQCVYTKFAVITRNFGNLPLDLDGYDPSTGVISLHVDSEWTSLWHNTCCDGITTNLAAATTLYAAEVITVFNGEGMIVTGVHVENTVPTTLASSGQRFGGPLPMQLTNFNIAWGVTLGDNICCNNAGPTSNQIANFYIQDNLDFIGASLDMVLDGINGAGGNNNAWDRALVGVGGGGAQRGRLEFRHVMPITTGTGAQVGIMEFNFRNNSATFGNQFDTSIYYGSQGFGLGEANNGGLTESYAVTTADLWRAQGIGSSPFWGVRPASYAMPCITPAQVTALASPAAITWTATLQYAPISAAGSKYQVGDTLTVSGGTASTAATINVDAVNGSGGITLAHVTNPGVNSYTAEPSAPVSVTGGHGLGAQFGVANVFGGSTVSKILWWYVNYSVAYPMLWGGTIYHVCDYKGGSRTKYALESTNLGYSYFQSLTTTNVPNLNWRSHDSSPVIWMNPEALELMFPGLAFSLTPTAGTTGCTSAGTETFMVTEVHPTAGYVIVVNAGQNGSPYLPQWGNGLTCTGTTIGQARANIVNPF